MSDESKSQETQSVDHSRRSMIRKMAVVMASLPLVPLLGACTQKSGTGESGGGNAAAPAAPQTPAAAAAEKPVDPDTDTIAKSLGYVADANQVDTAKFPTRKGEAGAKQFCRTCSYYTAKDDKWGHCQVIQSGLVASGGWCNSWNLKGA
ncbi:MAG: high-potential iron-sulfur protein [Oligoflexia bacterium]|nr:high-potential iron-sulfur protein [Oligoflexia bacterium]